MKTFVEFRSNKFPPYDGEEEDINPGLWGKRLAEYFVLHLPKYGIETEGIIAEDWGWYIPICSEDYTLAICCGHQYGDDDEFLCFTDPREPVVRKLLTRIDVSESLMRLTEAMKDILIIDEDIRDIQWYSPEEFESPAN